MVTTPRRLVVVTAVAVLGLASCGSTSRLTRAEFVAQGNAVCAESEEKLGKAFDAEFAGEREPTPKQMQAVLVRVVSIAEGTVAGLTELEPPANLEQRFDRALADARRAIVTLRNGAASPDAAQALFAAEEDPFAKANKGFEAVGVTTCSEGSGSGGTAGAGAGAVSFSATEYAFAGPPSLEAGTVTISLTNRGTESHEMSVVRLKDATTAQQVVDADAAGKDTADLVADDDVGSLGPVAAGAAATAKLDLVPGTYAYACFVDAPDGQPHVAKGMFSQFIVR